MSQEDPYADALITNQALHEALELVIDIRELLDTSFPNYAPEPDPFDRKSRALRSLMERFSPRLNQLGRFSARLSILADESTGRRRTSKDDIDAADATLAELESAFRQSSAAIEQMDKWVRADGPAIVAQIAVVADAVTELHAMFERSNTLRANPKMEETFRATVVALLSSVLEELKAPAVNTRRLGALRDMLNRVVRRTAEKELGEAAEAATNRAAQEVGRLLDKAREIPPLDGMF